MDAEQIDEMDDREDGHEAGDDENGVVGMRRGLRSRRGRFSSITIAPAVRGAGGKDAEGDCQLDAHLVVR